MHQVKHIRIRFSYVLPIPPVCICLPMYIFSHVLLCVCVYLSPCVFALCVCPPMCVCFPVHVSPPNVYMSPCAYCPQVFSTEVFVPMHIFVLIYALRMSLSLCAYTSSQAYVSPHVYILHAYFPVFPLCMCPCGHPRVCVPMCVSPCVPHAYMSPCAYVSPLANMSPSAYISLYVCPCTCFPPVCFPLCGCPYMVCIKRLVVHCSGSFTPLSQSSCTGRGLAGSDLWLHHLHSVDWVLAAPLKISTTHYNINLSKDTFSIITQNTVAQKILCKLFGWSCS